MSFDPNNPTIEPQNYKPSNFTIASIAALGVQTLVTTVVAHNLVRGQLVRFHIPLGYQPRQLNEMTTYVAAVNTPTTFIADINISAFDTPSSPPPGITKQTPQVSAVGDNNLSSANPGGRSPNGMTTSGAFTNIS